MDFCSALSIVTACTDSQSSQGGSRPPAVSLSKLTKGKKKNNKNDENRKTTIKRDENRMGQSSVKFNSKII